MSTSDKLGDAYVELSVTGDLAGQVEKERDKAQERAKRRPVSIKTQLDAKGGGEALMRSLGGKGAFGTETAVASGVVGASVRFGQSASGKVDPIMALLARSSAPKDASDKMIAGMSAAGEGQRKADERARADAEASRQAMTLGKAFNSLGKATDKSVNFAMMLLGRGAGMIGALSGAGMATAGAAAGAAGTARFYGGMADPGAGYRFDRAVADAQASLGRGLVPGLEYATGKVRQFGDIVAGNQKSIEKLTAPIIALTEFVSGITGLNEAAAKNRGLSSGAAVSPYTGRFSSGEEYYKMFAAFALTNTPPGGTGRAGPDQGSPSVHEQAIAVGHVGYSIVNRSLEDAGRKIDSLWKSVAGPPPRNRTGSVVDEETVENAKEHVRRWEAMQRHDPIGAPSRRAMIEGVEKAPTGHELDLTVIW